MRETVTMWRSRRMVLFVVLTAAAYASLLIPFGELAIVPGFVTLRPGNVVPVVAGILLGPAGAWGSAVGNIVFETVENRFTPFSPPSLIGFVGNFFFGLVGYRLWGSMGPLSSGEEPRMRSVRQIAEFGVVTVAASALCAGIIAWGSEMIGLFPFSVLGTTIFLNNAVAALILGPPLLFLAYPWLKKNGLLYTEAVRNEDLPSFSSSPAPISLGIVVVSLLWLTLGVAISFATHGVLFEFASAKGMGGSPVQIALGGIGFVAVLVLFVLGGECLSELVER